MPSVAEPTFLFRNEISPSYIEPLFLQMKPDIWLDTHDMKRMLHDSGLDIGGKDIVTNSKLVWSLLRIVDSRLEQQGRSTVRFVRLAPLGEYLHDTHSTNPDLFYDLFHYLFYSAWRRTQQDRFTRFWLYAACCDLAWQQAPTELATSKLTRQLQRECDAAFPKSHPSFSGRSVGGILPWLQVLSPPFLRQSEKRNLLVSERRRHCTPQLFHLALDLVYAAEGLQYGTAMAIGPQNQEAICKVCLLDPDRFWAMAELTEMTIRGVELQRGQWGSSLVLKSKPKWIDLPDYMESDADNDTADDESDEDEEDV
ncbi:MAG: hypothetical protein KBG20_01190 [Caldilineaceae bacterium]|nr:hypothetical protein [Caldilineaceae bacterium]MBP8106601.1 hypothetical protein [Caldilineaceae bacterium]MBP8121308.1 hypothetical protein [Caldilineaceae bacterium]MBP9070874.1 hypothetical protein [Caldilineaceae bacterium]